MHPVLKVAGVVHIWYYIPLCTIFAQQLNGDAFRTKFHNSKIKFPKTNTHFKGGLFSSSVWQSMADIRRFFKDPNHLALQELGWKFNSGLLKRYFAGVLHHFNHLSRKQVLQHPLTIQLVHTGNTQVSCMALAQMGQFSPTVQLSRWLELYWPNSNDTAGDSPSGSAFQLLTNTGHLSAPGDFLPS
ncbi:hypothetical protein O181_012238 [Austropuccinia psidii MF-1]|uniref:Uncharacterized protein n=1 Tax=Austropuccinia psidii MF-1 TaxID=1389203 RepID=A0A9Q3GM14_9BASI|nr:hypothetical protein [Austropuccinia psidii MF-1]